MKHVIFLLLFQIFLNADPIGLAERTWISIPTPASDTQTLEIGKEIIIPQKSATPAMVEPSNHDSDKYQNILGDFISPMWDFIEKYTAQFIALLGVISSLFYFIFYRPLTKNLNKDGEGEDEIALSSTHNKSPIFTNLQYSTLHGLINESFIYEKEHVLLDKSLSFERQNREVIALEWKFNQLLHFALPKLTAKEIARFKEGVYELLEEELTRDIMMIALEDIIKEDMLLTADKQWIKKEMQKYDKNIPQENEELPLNTMEYNRSLID